MAAVMSGSRYVAQLPEATADLIDLHTLSRLRTPAHADDRTSQSTLSRHLAATANVPASASQSTGGNHTIATAGWARPDALATSDATEVTHSTRKYCI